MSDFLVLWFAKHANYSSNSDYQHHFFLALNFTEKYSCYRRCSFFLFRKYTYTSSRDIKYYDVAHIGILDYLTFYF